MRATQAHIHLDNLRKNIEVIKGFVNNNARICIPVKANAYGHGATRVAIAAIKSGADFLAVASIQEGIELREAGIVAPILSLSLPTPDEIPSIIVHSITPLVFDPEFITQLADAALKMHRTIPVHLKIDTGMGRIGCPYDEACKVAELIASKASLFLEGTCTHFAASDSLEESDIEYTKLQFSRFTKAVESIRKEGINPGIVHCANSGAVLLYPEMHLDMVRPGIIVYGYFPDEGSENEKIRAFLEKKHKKTIEFFPVMEVKTQVVTIKRVKKGDSISYGRTWTAEEDTDIATLPIGYADGLLRRLSPGLNVLINGKLYPVVGRICMDQCMVNLGSKHDVKLWDQVTVFGPDKNGPSAAKLAYNAGTIPYEITCDINKRVPRIYFD
ncbi:MAG: alanine racemase [Treponemataceae bacterium]|nr:alanine racemase [Treponemataceae bacterium]